MSDIAYGNGIIAVTQENGNISYTTNDGSSWEYESVGTIKSLLFDGSKFVAASYVAALIYWSVDCSRWTSVSNPLGDNTPLALLYFTGEKYVAIGSTGYLYLSDNLEEWQKMNLSSDYIPLAAGDKMFVSSPALHTEYPCAYLHQKGTDRIITDILTADYVTWTPSIANGLAFMLGRNSILISKDLEKWSSIMNFFNDSFGPLCIAYGNSMYLAIGSEGKMAKSVVEA